MTSTTSRRTLLASLPAVVAATAAPVTAIAASSETPDPIFAAIEAVKSAREARNALRDQRHALKDKVPSDLKRALYGDLSFAVGTFKGQPLYVSSEDELTEMMTKRLMVVFVERGVDVEGFDFSVDSPEKSWVDVEFKMIRKHFDEEMERRERAKVWRNESGYDHVDEAFYAAEDALTEAQQVLVETKPTTAAGLVALLELLAEGGAPWGVDDWEDTVYPTIAEAARKFMTA